MPQVLSFSTSVSYPHRSAGVYWVTLNQISQRELPPNAPMAPSFKVSPFEASIIRGSIPLIPIHRAPKHPPRHPPNQASTAATNLEASPFFFLNVTSLAFKISTIIPFLFFQYSLFFQWQTVPQKMVKILQLLLGCSRVGRTLPWVGPTYLVLDKGWYLSLT